MDLKPMPGYAHITPESKYQDTGLIVIPEKYRGRKMAVGRIVSWSASRKYRCSHCGNIQHISGSCRYCQSRKVFPISKTPIEPFGGENIAGRRILYAESAVVPLPGELFRIPIDDILAAIDDDVVLDQAERASGVKRCVKCGPAKEGSSNAMILVQDGGVTKCPRCGWVPD